MELGKLNVEKQNIYLKVLDKYKSEYGVFFDEEDRYDQAEYLHETGKETENITEKNVENINDLIAYFAENKDEILEILKTGNLAIISNHATWANLPILAYAIHKGLGISYEEVFIILGPAITANKKYRNLVRQVANVLKTWPASIDKKYFRTIGIHILKNFKESVKNLILNKKGKIILIAPSGTTDKFENEKIIMKKPVDGVVNLIKNMVDNVIYIGINDREVFSNKKPEKGNVYFEASEIKNSPESVTEIIDNLKELVVDSYGNKIGDFYKLNSDGKMEIISD